MRFTIIALAAYTQAVKLQQSEEAFDLANTIFEETGVADWDTAGDWDYVYDYELEDVAWEYVNEGELDEEDVEWIMDTFDALDEDAYGLEGFLYYGETVNSADALLADGSIEWWAYWDDSNQDEAFDLANTIFEETGVADWGTAGDWDYVYDYELEDAAWYYVNEGELDEEDVEWIMDTFDALDEDAYGLEGYLYYGETVASAEALLNDGSIDWWAHWDDEWSVEELAQDLADTFFEEGGVADYGTAAEWDYLYNWEIEDAAWELVNEGELDEEDVEWVMDTFDALDEDAYGLEGFLYYGETVASAEALLNDGSIEW